MKRKLETKEKVHNKIYSNLNVNYSLKDNFRQERKNSMDPKNNIINSDFKLWYDNQIILKKNFTPKNKSTEILQEKRLSKENFNNVNKIETEPIITNNIFRRNNEFIYDFCPQQIFMTRKHSRNKKENINHNTDKVKHTPLLIKGNNEIESKHLFSFNKGNLLNVRVKVHKFLTEEFYKKNMTSENEEDSNQNEENKNELNEDINIKANIIGSSFASSERRSDNYIIKNKINHIDNIKKKINLTSKQSIEDIKKRNQDLKDFLSFTNKIGIQPNSTKSLFKKEIIPKIPKPKGKNSLNKIKKNLNLKDFQILKNKHNNCKKKDNNGIIAPKNKVNNIQEIIKIEEKDSIDFNKNKYLRESFRNNLKISINSNPERQHKLNQNTKEFVLKKVKKKS